MAAALGQPFMPWQRFVADVGCEIDPDTGLPAYREVGVTVPRQSGKTTLFLSWQLNRCVSARWSQPQRSAFTAQSGKDARDKWIDELFPLIRTSKIKPLIARRGSRLRINEGMGNESIHFKTGSLIRILSTSSSSGHSKTLDQAVLDELWHDEDDRREQGLRPAMATRPSAQLLWCSTEGTQKSVVLARKVGAGRAAATEDSGNGTAYFEWSPAAGQDWDHTDEDSYFTFMPALCPSWPCQCDPAGRWKHTITLEVVRAERQQMPEQEFRRAFGNIRTVTETDREIPADLWDAVQDPDAAPGSRPTFGLDVDRERGTASVAVSDGQTVEVIWCGAHTDAVAWFAAKASRRRHPVVIDDNGPASSIGDELEGLGVEVVRLNRGETADACGKIYDAIADRSIKVRPSFRELDDAVAAVAKKPLGDRFVWSRSSSGEDVTPLWAVTLAFSQRPRRSVYEERGLDST